MVKEWLSGSNMRMHGLLLEKWARLRPFGNNTAICLNCFFTKQALNQQFIRLSTVVKIKEFCLVLCSFNNFSNYTSTTLPWLSVWYYYLKTMDRLMVYVTGFWLTNISVIDFSLNEI